MRTLLPVFLLVCPGNGQTPGPDAARAKADVARGILAEGLIDKNPDTRKHAVSALGLIGPDERHVAQLEQMLNDKDVEVRLAALTSLMDLRPKRLAALLRKALEDDVPEVSFAAAKGLWAMNDPEGKDALMAVLSGEQKVKSSFLSKQKRDTLRMIRTPKGLFFTAARVGVAFAPVPGLGYGVSSVQSILSDPGVSGRAATALLLATDKDPLVEAALIDALSDKDWSVRAAAAHALALRNQPAMQKEIEPLMEDKKDAVKFRAAAGYLRLEIVRHELSKPKPKPVVKKAVTNAPTPAPAKPAAAPPPATKK